MLTVIVVTIIICAAVILLTGIISGISINNTKNNNDDNVPGPEPGPGPDPGPDPGPLFQPSSGTFTSQELWPKAVIEFPLEYVPNDDYEIQYEIVFKVNRDTKSTLDGKVLTVSQENPFITPMFSSTGAAVCCSLFTAQFGEWTYMTALVNPGDFSNATLMSYTGTTAADGKVTFSSSEITPFTRSNLTTFNTDLVILNANKFFLIRSEGDPTALFVYEYFFDGTQWTGASIMTGLVPQLGPLGGMSVLQIGDDTLVFVGNNPQCKHYVVPLWEVVAIPSNMSSLTYCPYAPLLDVAGRPCIIFSQARDAGSIKSAYINNFPGSTTWEDGETLVVGGDDIITRLIATMYGDTMIIVAFYNIVDVSPKMFFVDPNNISVIRDTIILPTRGMPLSISIVQSGMIMVTYGSLTEDHITGEYLSGYLMVDFNTKQLLPNLTVNMVVDYNSAWPLCVRDQHGFGVAYQDNGDNRTGGFFKTENIVDGTWEQTRIA